MVTAARICGTELALALATSWTSVGAGDAELKAENAMVARREKTAIERIVKGRKGK